MDTLSEGNMPRTSTTREANVKEWAKSNALDCLRRAAQLEQYNIFSEEAAMLHAEAIQVLRSAGLSLDSIQGQYALTRP